MTYDTIIFFINQHIFVYSLYSEGLTVKNARKINYDKYLDKVYGCYIGKAISGNIGAPHEGVKMPLELSFMPEMINCSLPNDDLDLQVLWLDVAERKGPDFSSYDLLERFVNYCSYSPGEYAVMRKNFNRGIYPPYSGKFCNDYYTEGMGCPIRSEIWACLAVGNGELAAEFAGRDGQLDHYGESINAERFLACLESEAFFESDIHVLINKAMRVLPENSAFRELVKFVCGLCAEYSDMKTVLSKILFRYGHPDCTNMYQNMGITLAALLLGENDIIKTSLLALNCGFDTDCTCATAGAVIGLLRGADELIKAYGLTEITYSLGVRSSRRSNLIFDLAEDIVSLGVEFTKSVNSLVTVENAPIVSYSFDKPNEFSLKAEYDEMKPYIAIGGSRTVTLCISQAEWAESPQTLICSLESPAGFICSLPEFTVTLSPGDTVRVPVVITLPSETEFINDKNIFTFKGITKEDGAVVLTGTFGLAGAAAWKLSGPFWRTEPVCTTKDVLENFSLKYPYSALIPASRIPGNNTDKKRHFHLNFAVDTQTEYVPEDELFEPLVDDDTSKKYETRLISIPEDSFVMDDLFGFKGPCAAYLSRVISVREDIEVCVQIGYSSPFRLILNGETIAERENCDNWTAENVHLEKIKLRKGDNRLVLRMTRANSDAKYNVTFSKGMACAEHIVGIVSKNPYKF